MPLEDQNYHYHALKTASHLALTLLILHSISVTVLVMVEPWCLTACIVKEETVLGDSLRCLSRLGVRSLNLLIFQVYSRSVPKEGRDELTALNQILQDTATEIIDIASIEHTQGVEQADYNEKAAHYAKRLAQVKVALFLLPQSD